MEYFISAFLKTKKAGNFPAASCRYNFCYSEFVKRECQFYSMNPILISIVEDITEIREGLHFIVNQTAGFQNYPFPKAR